MDADNNDARFWAGILAKFSDTLLERDQLQREREEHNARARDFLKQTAQWMHIPALPGSERDQCIATKRLLTERLNFASASIEELRAQNAALAGDKQRLSEGHTTVVNHQTQELASMRRELAQLRADRDEKSLHDTQTIHDQQINIMALTQNLRQAQDDNGLLRQKNKELEEKLQYLHTHRQEDYKRLEQENSNLRTELHKLKGLKDSNMSILTGLQERVRKLPQVAHGTNATNNANTNTTSSTVLKALDNTAAGAAPTTRLFLKLPSAASLSRRVKEEAQPGVVRELEDETTMVDTSMALNRPSYATPIPKARQDTFKAFSDIVLDCDNDTNQHAMFTRTFLSNNLGGSFQPLVVKVGKSRTSLSERHGLTSYLCPNLDLNPWSPTVPGEHGYMFVGLGSEKDTFITPEVHHVFVGFKNTSSQGPRLFRYMGLYSASRVDPLTCDEWSTLAANVQQCYARILKDRNLDSRSLSAILEDYKAGKLAVPCVQLKCIDYNEKLAAELAARLGPKGASSISAPPSSPTKRRREDQDGLDDQPRRKMVSRHARQLSAMTMTSGTIVP
ncbi:hypothetical protein HGRIS_007776 [Hohenbuehelia grisea]|uniref:DUF6697 domain-containing protein n=1 Tax=Hohenbuehelia grisea TaxID=104357 RepID=A0ABR3J6A8_9AGAR